MGNRESVAMISARDASASDQDDSILSLNWISDYKFAIADKHRLVLSYFRTLPYSRLLHDHLASPFPSVKPAITHGKSKGRRPPKMTAPVCFREGGGSEDGKGAAADCRGANEEEEECQVRRVPGPRQLRRSGRGGAQPRAPPARARP